MDASARSTRGQISAGGVPRFSSPKATSFATIVITTWSSGSWKTVAAVPASSDGPGGAGVEAGDDDAAGEAAAVEVRHEPGQRAQQRRLARAGRPEERHHLAGLELERDILQRRPCGRVCEREIDDGG